MIIRAHKYKPFLGIETLIFNETPVILPWLFPDTFDVTSRVLATEQAEIGGLKVLNYAPGPMDTDMGAQIRESGFTSTFEWVDVGASASKCIRLALGNDFESGSHIDFFDKEYD